MLLRLMLAGMLTVGLAPMASAQRGGGGGPQGAGGFGGDDSGGFGGPGGGRPYQANRLERFTDILKLTKEQQKDAKDIFDAAQKEAAPVRDQIRKARGDLATAYLQKQGQPQIDQLVANYGNLEAQMTSIELRAFSKLVDALNQDQQKRVGPAFQLMTGMFNGRNWNQIVP